MLRILLLLFCFAAVSGCRQKGTENQVNVGQDDSTITVQGDSHFFWTAAIDDKTGDISMSRARRLEPDSLLPGNLIQMINDQYPEIKLEFNKISSDTIFVKITDSNFLTQQMGSSGADMYLTSATYNLTELKSIEYVNFDFAEGDHAAPGTFSRTDFVNVLK